MSSMDDIITRLCNQTAVYWGNPKNDGAGYYTFDPPREIQCRWQDGHETVKDSKGREIVSVACIFVLEDLIEESYLWLGSLVDLDSDQYDHPHDLEGSYIIKKLMKSPSIKADSFVRKVYIG